MQEQDDWKGVQLRVFFHQKNHWFLETREENTDPRALCFFQENGQGKTVEQEAIDDFYSSSVEFSDKFSVDYKLAARR